MTRDQRQLHATVWPVVALIMAALILAGLAARPVAPAPAQAPVEGASDVA